MKNEGIFRVLHMRIDELDHEITRLYSGNPMSSFPGSNQTTNEYANGQIASFQEEKKFLMTVISLMVQSNNKDRE